MYAAGYFGVRWYSLCVAIALSFPFSPCKFSIRDALVDDLLARHGFALGLGLDQVAPERCEQRRRQLKAAPAALGLGWALRTYVRLIWHELETRTTRFATKLAIIRPAVQPFLTDPSVVLRGFPQAGGAHKRATA